MLPSPPWLRDDASCPRGRGPSAAPPCWGSLARSHRRTRLSGGDGSDALLAGQTSPMPRSSRQCPAPPSLRAFASMLGLGLNFGVFFGNLCHWQAGSCCHHPSNLQHHGAFNNLLGSCRGPQTLCKPGGELSSQKPHQAPGVTLMICPEGCDTLWLSPGIPNGSSRGFSYPQLTFWGSSCSKIHGVSSGRGRTQHLWGPECDFEDKSQAGPFHGGTRGRASLRLVALESVQELESSVGYLG